MHIREGSREPPSAKYGFHRGDLLGFEDLFGLVFLPEGKNGVKIISNVRLRAWFQKDSDVFNAGRVGSLPSFDSVFVALAGGNHDDSGTVLDPY